MPTSGMCPRHEVCFFWAGTLQSKPSKRKLPEEGWTDVGVTLRGFIGGIKKRGFVRKDVVFSQNPVVLFPLYMFFFALALFLFHTFASVLSNYARYWRFRVEAL